MEDERMEVDGSTNGLSLNGDSLDGGDAQHSYDEQLYSRQIYALGHTAMTKLRGANVLVSGMGSVGVELAKNLILGGVRSVTIQDVKTATWNDLSAQYYLTESDIGKNRASVSYDQLAELNDSVNVSRVTEPLTKELIQRCKFNVVVTTDNPWEEHKKVSRWARECNVKFIMASAVGLFGRIFCDLGPKFRVEDKNGEETDEILVEHICHETGNVLTFDNVHHGLEDGDFVTFSEVKGMVEINNAEPKKVKVINSKKFNIGSLDGFSIHTEGGKFKSVKMPIVSEFKSLEESIEKPDFTELANVAFTGRTEQLFLAWLALGSFMDNKGRFPAVYDETDAKDLVSIAKEINSNGKYVEELDEKILKAISYQAQGNLAPISGFIGAVAAQEVLKAVTNVFTPIKQWFVFDSLECLPTAANGGPVVSAKDCQPKNSRYDGQLAVFGSKFQEALGVQKWFIVGSGAIGCELLKYFSLTGLAAGPGGSLILTDMDNIEMSNLNRQFLFRQRDIGSKKSEVAAAAARRFNPALNITWLHNRVAPDTENTFSDDFFENLDGVCNALDNIEARTYMDRRCVYYRLPLLESGTLGPKGNTQVVYPHLTESYSSSQDPPETSIPICTVKNFPSKIEHCIQYLRELFELHFTTPAEMANQYLENPRAFRERVNKMNTGQQLEMLEGVRRVLIEDKPATAADCIHWARRLFELHFNNRIRQLLHNFPSDMVTKAGGKFWSGSKRCPHHLVFNAQKPEHLDFVLAGSILFGRLYNMEPITDRAQVAEIAQNSPIEPFEPRSGVQIAVTDAEETAHGADASEGEVENVWLDLAKHVKNKHLLSPEFFEKDDDSNYHMDFIRSGANLRGENYRIDSVDKLKAKQIAGKIIPALATTTAAVAGLVTLELYKVVMHRAFALKPTVESFKNGFLNLAIPIFAFSDPIAAPVKTFGTIDWTLWDRLDIQGDITLQQLIDKMKTDHNLTVTMVSQGACMLYATFTTMSEEKKKLRLNMKMSDLVESVSRQAIPSHIKALVLEMMCDGPDGEDVEIPYVRYILPPKRE